jgi:hypothetical protein
MKQWQNFGQQSLTGWSNQAKTPPQTSTKLAHFTSKPAEVFTMFNKIYRAIVIAQTRNAAYQLLNNATARQLDDMGINKATFADDMVAQVKAEFATADKAKNFPAMNPSWVGVYWVTHENFGSRASHSKTNRKNAVFVVSSKCWRAICRKPSTPYMM